MKILMTNHTHKYFAGSEVFTYTLAVELQRLGNEIICFSPRQGKLVEKLREEGIMVTDDLSSINNDIDLIHAHHRHEALLSFARFLDRPMILVCHGILPWQEQPLKAGLNIYKYVAVSEEVRDHLIQNHGIDPQKTRIIRNGVDLNRFYCKQPINPGLKHLLILSNHFPEQQLSIIKEACKSKGIIVEKVGIPERIIWNVEDFINQADIVITLGRGVLEAIACKRVVIVYDYNGADGLVTPGNYLLLRQKSFSGRTNKLQYTVDSLVGELDRCDPNIMDHLFDFAVKEHDISIIARQYLELYTDAISFWRENRETIQNNSYNLYSGINEALNDNKSQARTLEEMIKEKDLYIKSLKAAMDKKDQYIESEKAMGEKDRYVKRLEESIVEKDMILKKVQTVLEGNDKYIKGLNETIEKKR